MESSPPPSKPAERFSRRVRLAAVVLAFAGLTAGVLVVATLLNETSSKAQWWIVLGSALVALLLVARGWVRKVENPPPVEVLLIWLLALGSAATFVYAWKPTPRLSADLSAAAARDFGAALVLLPLLSWRRLLAPARGALVCASLLTALLATDAWSIVRLSGQETWRDIRWAGEGWRQETLPRLGRTHWPWGWLKATYPSNPRGYYELEHSSDPVDMRCFTFDVPPDVDAQIVRPTSRVGAIALRYKRPAQSTGPGVAWYHSALRLEPGKTHQLTFRCRAEGKGRLLFELRAHQPSMIEPLVAGTIELQDSWNDVEKTFEVPKGIDAGTIRFTLLDAEVPLELAAVDCRSQARQWGSQAAALFTVTYGFNADGFRERPVARTPAPNLTRVALFGDSFVLGYGVHLPDRLTERLEASLNHSAPETAAFEVLNFGTMGFSTRQSRACYEEIGARYQPQIVILSAIMNDGITVEEDERLGTHQKWDRVERSAGITREMYKWQFDELERIRRQRDAECVREIIALGKSCSDNGAKLMVIVYRFSEAENWERFARAVTAGLAGTGIPVFDLFSVLRQGRSFEQLAVQAGVDDHPNELANELAAIEIEKRLRELGWIESHPSSERSPPRADETSLLLQTARDPIASSASAPAAVADASRGDATRIGTSTASPLTD